MPQDGHADRAPGAEVRGEVRTITVTQVGCPGGLAGVPPLPPGQGEG